MMREEQQQHCKVGACVCVDVECVCGGEERLVTVRVAGTQEHGAAEEEERRRPLEDPRRNDPLLR